MPSINAPTPDATSLSKGKVRLTGDLAGTADSPQLATGGVVQVVSTNYSALATGTATIPADDTAPQISEGTQFMSQTITPKSATSKLLIQVHVTMGVTGGNRIIALFQDSLPDAIAATRTFVGSFTDPTLIPLTHIMTAGTTSPITFTVRGGSEGAGTWTFNGQAGTRTLGGTTKSNITVMEIRG